MYCNSIKLGDKFLFAAGHNEIKFIVRHCKRAINATHSTLLRNHIVVHLNDVHQSYYV